MYHRQKQMMTYLHSSQNIYLYTLWMQEKYNWGMIQGVKSLLGQCLDPQGYIYIYISQVAMHNEYIYYSNFLQEYHQYIINAQQCIITIEISPLTSRFVFYRQNYMSYLGHPTGQEGRNIYVSQAFVFFCREIIAGNDNSQTKKTRYVILPTGRRVWRAIPESGASNPLVPSSQCQGISFS